MSGLFYWCALLSIVFASIANIAAILYPLKVKSRIIKREMPLLWVVMILTLGLMLDGDLLPLEPAPLVTDPGEAGQLESTRFEGRPLRRSSFSR